MPASSWDDVGEEVTIGKAAAGLGASLRARETGACVEGSAGTVKGGSFLAGPLTSLIFRDLRSEVRRSRKPLPGVLQETCLRSLPREWARKQAGPHRAPGPPAQAPSRGLSPLGRDLPAPEPRRPRPEVLLCSRRETAPADSPQLCLGGL